MSNVSARPDQPAAGSGGQASGAGFLMRLGLWISVLSVAWVIFAYVAPIGSWFAEATSQAVEVDNLFRFMLAGGGVIFILVQALLVAFVVKYRSDQKDPEAEIGAQVHGNTRLELGWTAVPAVLLVVLASASILVWNDEHASHPATDLGLTVHGAQYAWTFDLPQYGINGTTTAAVLVNHPVYVSEYSNDVIHSFWVPEFRIKQDDVPAAKLGKDGKYHDDSISHEYFTPTRVGTYRVICTEFCGTGHSSMYTTIQVLGPSDFAAWLRKNGASTRRIETGNATIQVGNTVASAARVAR